MKVESASKGWMTRTALDLGSLKRTRAAFFLFFFTCPESSISRKIFFARLPALRNSSARAIGFMHPRMVPRNDFFPASLFACEFVRSRFPVADSADVLRANSAIFKNENVGLLKRGAGVSRRRL
eukprot:3214940-Rhodomonas_salina.2